jgi:hypothetical protein
LNVSLRNQQVVGVCACQSAGESNAG